MTGITVDLNIYEDEEALVQALHAGDKHACACMIKHHAPQMYAVAMRIMGDPHEAEEVLQEAFISACRKADTFQGRSKLSTWLYRITTNAALMRLRKRRDNTVSLDEPHLTDEGVEFPKQLGDWSVDPSQQALSAELREVMEEAVQQLPTSLRTTFILRDIQGLTTQETADALEISPGAVKVRLHRGRLKLRELLAGYLAGQSEEVAT
ncbi:MAG: sigma-70 family RNA polymerase sigma factor [Chloroflexota bacterium]|nr:sigma-70 family RNA polymerase sigma factor [Chloroflexota bacterium]